MCVYDIIGEGVVCERGIVSICWCSLRDVLCVVCVVYVQCNVYVRAWQRVPIVGGGDRQDHQGWAGLDWAGLG